MKFNEKIKFLRRSSKLTQEQVATYIGVKRVAYTAYEAGRTSPSLENVEKLKSYKAEGEKKNNA